VLSQPPRLISKIKIFVNIRSSRPKTGELIPATLQTKNTFYGMSDNLHILAEMLPHQSNHVHAAGKNKQGHAVTEVCNIKQGLM
jgi:hypothetical protein